MDNTQVGRCSMWQPSLPLKEMCHQRSGAIRTPPHSPTTLLRRPFYLARARKNNHPGHAPLLPIISPIYPHLSLCFAFLHSVVLPSHLSLIVFVFLCPRHCLACAAFCYLLFVFHLVLPALVSLSVTHYCSFFPPALFLVSFHPSSPPHGKMHKVSAQSSLSHSFILSTNNPSNSSCLICVYPPSFLPKHMRAHTHTRSLTLP